MPPTDNSVTFNTADFQLEPAAERFFDQAPRFSRTSFEPEALTHLPRTERWAMRATFAMLGVFAAALIGFLIYSRVLMPVPAELGAQPAPAQTDALDD